MLNIVPMKSGLEGFYNQIDNRYLVGEVVSVKVGRMGFSLSYAALPKAQWQKYPPNDRFTPAQIIAGRDTICYFAFLDGQLAGQAVLFENWNRLAMLHDIRIDARYRRQGIGKALIDAACDWAKSHSLCGIMLETQDTNPIACQFYESVGFSLGGVDRLLYTALKEQRQKPPALRDAALFFYRLF